MQQTSRPTEGRNLAADAGVPGGGAAASPTVWIPPAGEGGHQQHSGPGENLTATPLVSWK